MHIEPKLTCMTLTHFIVTSDSAVYSWQSAPLSQHACSHASHPHACSHASHPRRAGTGRDLLVSLSSTIKITCAM